MKSRTKTAGPTIDGSADLQPVDDAAADETSTITASGPVGRRSVLGAVAAGAFLAACGKGAETSSKAVPGSAGTTSLPAIGANTAPGADGVTSAGSAAVPGASGTEVVLPAPASPAQVVNVESSAGTATGSTASSTASPTTSSSTSSSTKPVMVVEDPSTSTTAAGSPAASDQADRPDQTEQPATTPPQTEAPKQGRPAPVTPVADGAFIDLVVTRLTYGYTPGLRPEVASIGAGAFIDDQLAKNKPDPAAERLAGAINGIADKTFRYNQTKRSHTEQLHRLGMSSLVRATNSEHQLFEVMSHFWADHFNVQADESELTSLNLARHYQEFVIRPNAMGKFRDLLHAVIRSPAMLEYLDQVTSDANNREGVNENLGREILELHSLGIDENERHIYSENDVQQASLALAGLTYRGNNRIKGYYEYFFEPKFAYNGDISLLQGQWTNAGLSGEEVANSMITFLANHSQTARYIAYKLCRRFVADFPPTSLVESTAAVFQANDTDIAPTLAHIFKSKEFARSSHQKYRRPFEFNAAAIRALGSRVVNNNDHRPTLALITKLQHLPWQHPTPDGYPDTAVEWITSGGMQDRWNLAGNLARGKTPIAVNKRNYLPAADTVDELLSRLAVRVGIGTLDAADRAAIATAGGVTGTDTASQLNNKQIAMMTGLVLSHPLFQTR